MGWLGIAGGFAGADSKQMQTEREQLFLEEQNLMRTMLPIAMQNRKERRLKKDSLKYT